MSEAKAIRKRTAQYDLFNRLHSIASDQAFVQLVARSSSWYDGRFPVIPNQRCGNWYCDPNSSSSSHYAYFKSTDGHTNNWDFNLRRSNLPFAKFAESVGGVILVDSTRRGKRMPDALSKTVPIWCAVINLALAKRNGLKAEGEEEWDTELYLSPNIVSPSERAQIQARLQGWAEALETSSLPLPELSQPLRPFFIHPSTTLPPHIPLSPNYTSIICLSASRWVGQGGDDIPSVTSLGKRKVGFEYVPGAGDDDELWGRGLTPSLFHANKAELLRVDREELEGKVDELVRDQRLDTNMRHLAISSSTHTASTSYLIGVPSSSSRLALNIGPPVIPAAPWRPNPSSSTTNASTSTSTRRIRVISIDKSPKSLTPNTYLLPLPCLTSNDQIYVLVLPNPKTDGKGYTRSLDILTSFARALPESISVVLEEGSRSDLDTAISVHLDPASPSVSLNETIGDQGREEVCSVEGRKSILPLALCLMSAVPALHATSRKVGSAENGDEKEQDGKPEEEEQGEGETTLSKSVNASTLHTLIALWPDGNPARASLKRVNEYLLS